MISRSEMATSGKELYSQHSWRLLYHFVRLNMALRYRRTVIGYIWTLINPLMMIAIMGTVFSVLFKQNFVQYTAFLFAGMVPWLFLVNVVGQATQAFIIHEALIKKVYLPKFVFPLSTVVTLFIDTLAMTLVLLLLILMLGGQISWAILFIPLSLLFLLLLGIGISLILSIIGLLYRDAQHIFNILMQALFYITPVLYARDQVPEQLKIFIDLNPITQYIDLFRSPFSYRLIPSVSTLAGVFMFTVITLSVGIYTYIKYRKKIIHQL